MLTDKGMFVLDLLKSGINRPWKDYEELWLSSRSQPKAVKRLCPTCKQEIG